MNALRTFEGKQRRRLLMNEESREERMSDLGVRISNYKSFYHLVHPNPKVPYSLLLRFPHTASDLNEITCRYFFTQESESMKKSRMKLVTKSTT